MLSGQPGGQKCRRARSGSGHEGKAMEAYPLRPCLYSLMTIWPWSARPWESCPWSFDDVSRHSYRGKTPCAPASGPWAGRPFLAIYPGGRPLTSPWLDGSGRLGTGRRRQCETKARNSTRLLKRECFANPARGLVAFAAKNQSRRCLVTRHAPKWPDSHNERLNLI